MLITSLSQVYVFYIICLSSVPSYPVPLCPACKSAPWICSYDLELCFFESETVFVVFFAWKIIFENHKQHIWNPWHNSYGTRKYFFLSLRWLSFVIICVWGPMYQKQKGVTLPLSLCQLLVGCNFTVACADFKFVCLSLRLLKPYLWKYSCTNCDYTDIFYSYKTVRHVQHIPTAAILNYTSTN